MKKYIVRNANNRIKGFVWQDSKGGWWYAFGRPSQDNYIAFTCRSLEHGKACIELPTINH